MNTKHWWKVILLIFAVSASGLAYICVRTYQDAPPLTTFVDEAGKPVVPLESIFRGQDNFHRYALMHYGTMFGDGSMRGPDFTAEALHQAAVAMVAYYKPKVSGESEELRQAAAEVRVQKEIKANRYDAKNNVVVLGPAQVHAYQAVVDYYTEVFTGNTVNAFKPAGYITDPTEIRDLASFFFWGGWVCGVERPGYTYSYTNNWPFDPTAGNTPTASVMLWSVLGSLALILVLGIVLYVYGKLDHQMVKQPGNDMGPVSTVASIAGFTPTPTQRATYKYFATAAVVFLFQIIAGILTVHDYVNFTTFFGVDISTVLPITVVRAWHVQMSVLWVSACLIATTIFVLPMISRPEPKGQLQWVNALYWMLVALVGGSLVGLLLGPQGWAGPYWRWLGTQGWEYMEMGRLWQYVLWASFGVWAVIMIRGIAPALRYKDAWSMPNWLLYTIISVILLFTSSFVAKPNTNFAIADFWRWMVIHMWVEAFFEVFTTIIVAYFMYIMGLVTAQMASRVVYLAAILFLGSGLLGISHNFYWNAKSIETIALGAVFSTMQVIPLILLTLEAWRFRHMPLQALRSSGNRGESFGLAEPFLFLIGVNFWNFMGAGVLGFIINLPIVNYYEHGTYLTVNHGHAALMGVYGNLSIAAMIFVARFVVSEQKWNAGLLHCVFWCMNIGLGLMCLLDLFPAGVHQLYAVIDKGLWFGRSQDFILGQAFQTMTWMRTIGGALFFVGGVIPLAWFMVTRGLALRADRQVPESERYTVPPTMLTMPGSHNPTPASPDRQQGNH